MGTPDDAALGLPLEEPEQFDEMTGPIGHVLPGGHVMKPHDGTTPGATTACRTDAASLSTKPDPYGVVLAREFDAYVKLRSSLTTDAQRTYLAAYDAAITDSREAFRAGLVEGGA